MAIAIATNSIAVVLLLVVLAMMPSNYVCRYQALLVCSVMIFVHSKAPPAAGGSPSHIKLPAAYYLGSRSPMIQNNTEYKTSCCCWC